MTRIPRGWRRLRTPARCGRLGAVHTRELDVDASRERIIDLTAELERFCAGLGDGLVNVFVPHASAAWR